MLLVRHAGPDPASRTRLKALDSGFLRNDKKKTIYKQIPNKKESCQNGRLNIRNKSGCLRDITLARREVRRSGLCPIQILVGFHIESGVEIKGFLKGIDGFFVFSFQQVDIS